jgi:dihydrofolate synthase / folylpolyglutamate synthase
MIELTPKPRTLCEWLDYIERIHPSSIEMGLDRLNQVKSNLNFPLSFPIISVSGTNGKGSVCSILESILSHAGYRVGCYTSPHLLRYNERIRIGQKEAGDDELCEAFNIIEAARVNSNVPLTYFEFGTLAAMELITKAGVDVAILEVGLGGRLDAVNIFDAECAVLTNVDYDHTEYLGDTREKIGFEKAGIFRSGKTAICSDIAPPASISQRAVLIESNLNFIGEHFGYSVKESAWDYWGGSNRHYSLPYPALGNTPHQLRNASACLAALDAVSRTLPVTINNISQGLLKVQLPGRFQVLPDKPKVIFDVAHNPSAMHTLRTSLSDMAGYQKTYAVFSALKDKDIDGVVQTLISEIDVWLVSGINSRRGASSDEIVEALENAGVSKMSGSILTFPDPVAAYIFACKQSTINDRICVFGSFYAVGKVMGYLEQEKYG